MTKLTYLDHAATTPLHPDALQAMMPYMTEQYANPSTLYKFGTNVRKAVEDARAKVAELIGAQPNEIFFTAGATESDNWAIMGTVSALESKGNHIISSSIEHHAVLGPCEFLKKRGYEITLLPVDGDGLVNPEDVKNAITDKTILITVMHSNNETGVIQPIEEIASIARENEITFHTDATQSVGKILLDVYDLGVDLLSLSGHKLNGPKGIGALYIRKGTRIHPYMHGGAQEGSRRAGTHNVPGIIGLGKAAEIAMNDMGEESARIKALRDRLLDGILAKIPDVRLNGHREKRLPNNINVSIAGIEGESMILMLDAHDICVSSGSACTSGSLAASHVLLAMGVPHELAHGSLRITLGLGNDDEDADKVLEVLPGIVSRLREMSPMYEGATCSTEYSGD